MRRRHWLAALAAGIAATGCGFELRRPPDLPFATIALAGFAPRSPLAEELRRQVATTTGTRVVEAPEQAQAILEALIDAREKSVVATTAFGQVREMQLRSRFRFRVTTPRGRELIAPSELMLFREISYSETAALAKEQEEMLLYRAMEADIALQVMRRLAALRGF